MPEIVRSKRGTIGQVREILVKIILIIEDLLTRIEGGGVHTQVVEARIIVIIMEIFNNKTGLRTIIIIIISRVGVVIRKIQVKYSEIQIRERRIT